MIRISSAQEKRIFTKSEAEQLLPLIYRVTESTNKEVKYLMSCIEALKDKSCESSMNLQSRANAIIDRWNNKMERLGLRPKGLWLADFDNGSGYFCWKFPETQILYFHGYQDGFSGRMLIQDFVKNEEIHLSNQQVMDKFIKDHHENSPSPN